MKTIVSLLTVAMAICSSITAISAVLTTNEWNFANTGETITLATDYFNTANWKGGIVAEGADAIADFSDAKGVRYVKLGRELDIYQCAAKMRHSHWRRRTGPFS